MWGSYACKMCNIRWNVISMRVIWIRTDSKQWSISEREVSPAYCWLRSLLNDFFSSHPHLDSCSFELLNEPKRNGLALISVDSAHESETKVGTINKYWEMVKSTCRIVTHTLIVSWKNIHLFVPFSEDSYESWLCSIFVLRWKCMACAPFDPVIRNSGQSALY